MPNWLKKGLKYFWITVFSGIGAFIVLILLVNWGVFGPLPTGEEIANPEANLATQIVSDDGELLGTFFVENRINADYEELPPYIYDALVATEDHRFYSHAGIDFRSLGRVFIKTILSQDQGAGGGSTISQQVAKNLFKIRGQSVSGNKFKLVIFKLKEWVTAVKLEKRYTKEELMLMYFNTVTYMYNADGIKAASKTYFNKPIDSLNLGEAATLVGMVKNPSLYNPVRRLEKTQERRNTVLGQMRNRGYISKEICDSVINTPLEIELTRSSHNTGLAPYLREHLRIQMDSILQNHAEPNPNGKKWDVYADGLKIYTTINSKMQTYAEEAVAEHLKEHQQTFNKQWARRSYEPWERFSRKDPNFMNRERKNSERYRLLKKAGKTQAEIDTIFNTPTQMTLFSWEGDIDTTMSPNDSIKYMNKILHAGFMAVDPGTGQVKAWVGGIDHRYFKLNHVNTRRQVGSTFKPFIYLMAMELGWSPCFEVPLNPPQFGTKYQYWRPRNSGGGTTGTTTLKTALAKSINTVAARIMYQFCTGEPGDDRTPQPIIDFVRKLGITSPIPPSPSICLGTADISLFEMVEAYTSFANKGVKTTPYLITRIEDKNGRIIYRANIETKEVLSEERAYLITQMMMGVVNQGTGNRLRRAKYGAHRAQIAGKTGTTQDNSDGWFIGFTPQLVAGAWVGADKPSVRFLATTYGQGAAMALPIYGYFMRKVFNDKSLGYDETLKFEKPGFELDMNFDCKVDETLEAGVGYQEETIETITEQSWEE